MEVNTLLTVKCFLNVCLRLCFYYNFYSVIFLLLNFFRSNVGGYRRLRHKYFGGKAALVSRAPMGRARATQGTYLSYADFFPAFSRIFNLHNFQKYFFLLFVFYSKRKKKYRFRSRQNLNILTL